MLGQLHRAQIVPTRKFLGIESPFRSRNVAATTNGEARKAAQSRRARRSPPARARRSRVRRRSVRRRRAGRSPRPRSAPTARGALRAPPRLSGNWSRLTTTALTEFHVPPPRRHRRHRGAARVRSWASGNKCPYVCSICPKLVPMKRASSTSGTLAAIAKLATCAAGRRASGNSSRVRRWRRSAACSGVSRGSGSSSLPRVSDGGLPTQRRLKKPHL